MLQLDNYDHTIEGLLADTRKNYGEYGSGCVWHTDDPPREVLGKTHVVAFTYPYKIAELLDESNHEAIKAALEPYEDAELHSFGHWATPYDAFVVRVKDEEGKFTAAAKVVADLVSRLEDYPILDEDDLSMRELDATYENFRQEIRRLDLEPEIQDLDDVVDRVIRFMDNNPRWDGFSFRSTCDGGESYPQDDELRYVLGELGFTEAE